LVVVDDHDGVMVTEHDLLAKVDAAFEVTGRGLASWPDAHPGRSPLDEEYSRLTNPSRWRILGARADAWLVAVVDGGLAEVEPSAAVRWRVPPRTVISRTDHVAPYAAGALPLALARSQLGPVDDAGVTLGVGDPAIAVAWFPDCGCDACDSGSQDELDNLDAHILGIVSGAFRRLSAGNREITVIGEGGWTASGLPARYDVDAVLADPTGWDEVAGTSWLHHV
jgi:Family of unknown function (DUF6226)